ncbi:gluconokinase [Ruania halotolerans]|uniref:gluconokinase n=1 Tax=Ruania halotolerans TaxID=2897773 RepID=UPI001E4643D3|nr:gluconokinase [Ruania halotolerans]UFU06752.1 gluconokinase [Ruania halotolerans]
MAHTPRHIVVMGVSGNGKSTIGAALADRLGAVFLEGDEFHPQANVAKMSAGIPLTDDDRWPWLDILAAEIARRDEAGERTVLACSALRRAYRDRLRARVPDLFFIHPSADYDTIHARMQAREHFMPPALLRSQFDTLEPLGADEAGDVVDATAPPSMVIAEAIAAVE